MQRRTSQTFQRIRKLSDSIIHAVVPTASSNCAGPHDSFFEYDKKGWHAPEPPTVRRRPSYRKVSKEEIRYPLIHPADNNSTLELWVESATMSAERTRRPPRPSVEERPQVVRDPALRREEERLFRSVDRAKRPERPRERDLPYGRSGGMPRALVGEERSPPPPAAAAGRRASVSCPSASVAFPSHAARREEERPAARGVHRGGGGRDGSNHGNPPEPPPKIYTPFAPVLQREIEKRRAQTATATRTADRAWAPTPPPSATPGAPPMRTHQRRQHADHEEGRRSRPRELTRMAMTPSDSQYALNAPMPGRRHGAIRRISSSGDVNLPPQHARYRPSLRAGDENERSHAPPPAPELRTVRSTPLSSRQPPAVFVPLPAHPAVHLQREKTMQRSRHPDVPRDVSPDNPQRLPTPRKSTEAARPTLRAAALRERERERARERVQDAPRPTVTVSAVAKAQASVDRRVKELSTQRPVEMAMSATIPQHVRAVAYTAQVVHSAHEGSRVVSPEKERHRDRYRDREKAPRDVQYYGMADAFARQIALALAEPERSEPLSIDWEQFVAGGKDYGTKPLVMKKERRA